MIPPVDDVVAAHQFLARRFNISGRLNEQQVAEALDEARALAGDTEPDQPAALFFALSRRPRSLGGLWRALPQLLALSQARDAGLRVHATADEWRFVRLSIASGSASFHDVQAWFAKRLKPFA